MTNKNDENRDEWVDSKNDVLDIASQTVYKLKVILGSRLKESNVHLSLEDLLIMQELHLDLLKNTQEITRLLQASNKRVNSSLIAARKVKNKRRLSHDPNTTLLLDDLSRLYQDTLKNKENRPNLSETAQPSKPPTRSSPTKSRNKDTVSNSRKKKESTIDDILNKK